MDVHEDAIGVWPNVALGLWRRADTLRLAGRAPSQEDLDEMAALLAGLGIEAS